MIVVELQDGCWLCEPIHFDDPNRTFVIENAHRYADIERAKIALDKARMYRPFIDAKMKEVE